MCDLGPVSAACGLHYYFHDRTGYSIFELSKSGKADRYLGNYSVLVEYKASGEDDDSDEEFEDFFDEYLKFDQDYWQELHIENVYSMYAELTIPGFTLAKSQRFFARTVGLKVHFDVLPDYMEADDSPTLLKGKVAAHLILPRYQCAMKGMLRPSPSLPFLC